MTSRKVEILRLDIEEAAKTILPIELGGVEIALEARAYQTRDKSSQAVALINRGQGADRTAVPVVRVHSGCITGDIFHSLRCDCYAQLQAALARISSTPNGVLVYLPFHEGRGIGLFNKIRAYAMQDKGLDTVDANLEIGSPVDARDYDLAAEILRDLGFPEIRLMTNNPAKVEALRAAGIRVIERLPLVITPSPHNARYLETKRSRLSHKL